MGLFTKAPRATLILVIFVVAMLLFVIWVVVAFNGLVAKQVRADAQWAQVENQYQRKIDLLPGLVNLTEQYAEFERSTLQNITELRTRWLSARGIPEQVNLTNLLNLVIADLVSIYESYPALHFPAQVRALFDEVTGTENRIVVERQRFNDAVRLYETSRRSFPDSIVAGWFGFQHYEYYDPIP